VTHCELESEACDYYNCSVSKDDEYSDCVSVYNCLKIVFKGRFHAVIWQKADVRWWTFGLDMNLYLPTIVVALETEDPKIIQMK